MPAPHIPLCLKSTSEATYIRLAGTVRRDEHYGFQLYQSNPSGNYGGWKAAAIGAGHAAANNVLKTEYKEDITLAEVRGG